jgi:hypothetical protein
MSYMFCSYSPSIHQSYSTSIVSVLWRDQVFDGTLATAIIFYFNQQFQITLKITHQLIQNVAKLKYKNVFAKKKRAPLLNYRVVGSHAIDCVFSKDLFILINFVFSTSKFSKNEITNKRKAERNWWDKKAKHRERKNI